MKIFVTLVVAAGCGASINATPINPAPHLMTPRPPALVEMYTSGPPQRPHVDIALLEVEESSSLSTADTNQMISDLRNRGAQMGCDAIVLGGASSRDPGLGDAERWLNKDARGRKGFTATCIAYLPDEPIGAVPSPVAAASAPPPAPAAPAAAPVIDPANQP